MKTPALLAGAWCGFLRRVHISYLFQGLLIALRVSPKYSLLPAVLLLSACSSVPIVGPPVYIPTKVYLAIPAELTLPVTVDLTGQTYGEGLGSLRAGLETCNGQLTSIATLKPPPTL